MPGVSGSRREEIEAASVIVGRNSDATIQAHGHGAPAPADSGASSTPGRLEGSGSKAGAMKPPKKSQYVGRCRRCNAWLRYAEQHTCKPGAERYWSAVKAAYDLIRPEPDRPVTGKPITADQIISLPEPAPSKIEYQASAPRDGARESAPPAQSASVEKAPLVTLLPTVLLRETSAQRDGEPSTVSPRRYEGSNCIGSLRAKCRCTEIARWGYGGCTPAAEATRLHSLGWTYSVNLTAPSDAEFWERLAYFDRTGLAALDFLSTGLLSDPFYIISVVSPTPVRSRRRCTGFHAHLLLGNVNWAELRSLLSAWGDDR